MMRSVLIALFAIAALAHARLHHVISAEDSDSDAVALQDHELEEEEEEEPHFRHVPEKIQRVMDDARDVSRALEEADLPESAKQAGIHEANEIRREAEELIDASPAHARKLKAEMKEHLATLKQIQNQEEEEDEEEEDNSPAGHVVRDVKEVKSAISTDDSLSMHQKERALSILSRMQEQAGEYNSAASHQKREIKASLKSDLEELKSIVGANEERDQEEEEEEDDEEVREVSHPMSLEEKAARVENDVEEVKREIRHDSSLSASTKKAALANLDSIARDAEEYSHASAQRRHSLKEAMELRVSALRDQVGEN